ncbi:MAG: extracellular solute-binding protein [Solirubrobacterales bacterium]|nr:extracellular solute-binding protein [Solirubrobacterales bacterium]
MGNGTKWAQGVALAVAAVAIAGCGSSGGGGGSTGSAAKPVHLSFWGWAPGYQDSVKAFNASHPNIKVSFQQVTPGSKGGYQKMLTAVKAGNGPCLAQVGYETLPTFVAQGAVTDISSYANGSAGEFTPAAWNGVRVAGKTYGVPVDIGPMAMFYNKQLFSKYHIAVPKTWAQYRAAGLALKKANPAVKLTSGMTDYDFAGFDWQAGAPWYGTSGNTWKVSYNSPAGQKVANYWQSLVSDGLISKAPTYDPTWLSGLANGQIATVVGAVWQAGTLKASKPISGKFAVAPMPQWSAGANVVGNSGGSSTAVLKGCANTQAAWQFAHWMSTDRKSWPNLVTKGGLFPADKSLQSLPVLNAGDPFFGGQKIFQVFKAAAPNVRQGWVWGPGMQAATTSLNDGLNKAWVGKETVPAAISSAQKAIVRELKQQGLSVKS